MGKKIEEKGEVNKNGTLNIQKEWNSDGEPYKKIHVLFFDVVVVDGMSGPHRLATTLINSI